MQSQSVLRMMAIDGKSELCNELYCIVTIGPYYYIRPTTTTVLRPPGLRPGLLWWAGTRKVKPGR